MFRVLLLLVIFFPLSGWTQLCQDYRSAITGLGEMVTPKNTKIFSLYSQHMDPQDQNTIQKWLNSPIPMGDIAQLGRLLINKHTAILQQKRHELKVLADLHREKKISWVGIELSPQALDEFKPQLFEQAEALKKVLKEKGLSSQEADDLALLIYDSGHYFVAHLPPGGSGLHLVALEEERSYSKSLDHAAELSEARETLAAKTKVLRVPNSIVQEFDTEVSHILGENQKRKGQKKLKKSQARLVSRMPSSEGKALMRKSLETAHRFVEVSLVRDKKISEQIWKNSKSSGIFIYGRAHQTGITQSLIERCRSGI